MSWTKVKIGSFLTERDGRFKPSEANELGLKRIGKIDFSGTYHLVDKKTNTDMILVKKGDLLISGINAEKGAVTVYDNEEDALATIHYSSYEFNKKIIDVEYFRWFLISDAFINLLKEHTGSGIKKELRSKHLLPLEIYLPDIENQNFIVKQIIKKHKNVSAVLEIISNQQTHLQQLRQTILLEAVQGKLTQQSASEESADILLQSIKVEKLKLLKAGELKKEKELLAITEEEMPFELPRGWVWCRLGVIINLVSGVTLGKTYKEELFEVPYLRVANVQRGYVDITHLKELRVPKSEIEKYGLKNGDLVMIEGGDWDKVGRCAIWNAEVNPCIHQNHIFRMRFYGNISNHWAELFLNSPVARRYFESCSKQTTNLASINKTQLTNTLVPLPPCNEQQLMVAKVQQLLHMVNELEQLAAKNQTQAQQLLQAVLKEAFGSPSVSSLNKKGKGKVYEENELITLAAEP